MMCFPAHSTHVGCWTEGLRPLLVVPMDLSLGKFVIWLLASISNEAREQEVEHKMEASVFCSLMLEVTSHHSCCILLEACH